MDTIENKVKKTDLSVEVLISTMNYQSSDFSYLKKQNIQTDSIVCNQADHEDITSHFENKLKAKNYSLKEKGVGRSRNFLLMRSKADICILADDDMEFYSGYEKKVLDTFKNNEDADIVIFNIDDGGSRYKNKKTFKVNRINYTRYGAARIAFRRQSILRHGVYFNLNFGGGSQFGSGEDTLFLNECLKKGLNIIAVNQTLAKLLDNRDSTWFEGYTKNYWQDKGALFAAMERRFTYFNILQYSLRKYKLTNGKLSFFQVYNNMRKGVQKYKKFMDKGR